MCGLQRPASLSPSAFQGPSTPWHVHLPVLPPYRWTAFHCVVHRTVSVRSPPDGHLGCFRFSDRCEWHNDELVCTRFWWTCKSSSALGITQGELAGRAVTPRVTFWGTAGLFSDGAAWKEATSDSLKVTLPSAGQVSRVGWKLNRERETVWISSQLCLN